MEKITKILVEPLNAKKKKKLCGLGRGFKNSSPGHYGRLCKKELTDSQTTKKFMG